ncbi:hypothetical protein SAMN05443144_10191 [Fodinibius roseus]|uniref:Polysaccharide (De)acetylase n=1 Tax=Fodinibius roseus TaxID=1194090 RepID=A0A1M4SPT1_9BACT|nr:hypothetical protein [Fodinibius roseus]SHE34189.1 hypothetical protein SAMN05443144_10191 [Fodinibius roseus]
MINKLKSIAKNHLVNVPGWRTNRKIVVFESDDWGTIRMSSGDSLSKLSESGIKVQNCHYVQNDALASEEDLEGLFNLLSTYKGVAGSRPTITANVIMTNPDFDKIRASGYTKYHNELFTETLDKYPEHKGSFRLWKEGISEGLFHPQFHGREHVQVMRWMSALRDPDSETRKAFDVGVFGLSTTVTAEKRKSYMASYDWDDTQSRDFILKSIANGLSLFTSLFGFQSLSSIAPNYTWHNEVEKVLNDRGTRYIQGGRVQKSPQMGREKFNKKRHFTGQKNDLGQIYLVRNCKFEPSSNHNIDWVDRCMSNIKTAFLWKKPAIIEMHRVNTIGFINPQNRSRNLKKLDQLLKRITKTWPDVEFMTSDQLGKAIENNE